MTETILFRSVRSVARAIRAPLDNAYVIGGQTASVDGLFDPYDLYDEEEAKRLIALTHEHHADALSAIGSALIGATTIGNLPRERWQPVVDSAFSSPELNMAAMPSGLDRLDAWLVAQGDAPDPAALAEWIGALLIERDVTPPKPLHLDRAARAIVSQSGWLIDRMRFALLLVLGFYREQTAELIELRGVLTRRLMVASAIETMALLDPKTIDGPAIYRLLHRRPLLIHQAFIRPLKRAGNLARRPAVADLYVLRQGWAKYALGEISSVEPLMGGESKTRLFERRSEVEDILTSSESASSSTERDNQSTDRFELSTHVASSVSQSVGVEGWLNVDTEMPTTKVSAHIGADYSFSSETQRASDARSVQELVNRAISKVTQQTTRQTSQRRLQSVVDSARHAFENKGEGAVNGVYRWVDKIDRVDLLSYPNRYMFELQIPEPAAWLRWLLDREAARNPAPQPPGPFPTVHIDDISTDPRAPTYYLSLAQMLGAEALPAPPETLFVADQIKGPPESQPDASVGNVSKHDTPVPRGYVARRWRATAVGIPYDGRVAPSLNTAQVMHIAVGAGPAQRLVAADHLWMQDQIAGEVGTINEGLIPVVLNQRNSAKYAVNLEIECEPGSTLMANWRMDVMAALRAAHDRRQLLYEDAKAQAEASGRNAAAPRPPVRNRELMIAELKRLSIEMLSDDRVRGLGGMEYPGPNEAPVLDRAIARNNAARIQFVEQAFEWSNMSFVFYPSFWTHETRWERLIPMENDDPDFAAFLRAGSVRIVIPARPGYEYQAQLFVDYGVIWGGGAAPGPDDPDYLSIATEIEDMQRGAEDGELVRSWKVTLPTTLIALDETGHFPMLNPDLPLP